MFPVAERNRHIRSLQKGVVTLEDLLHIPLEFPIESERQRLERMKEATQRFIAPCLPHDIRAVGLSDGTILFHRSNEAADTASLTRNHVWYLEHVRGYINFLKVQNRRLGRY